MNILYLNGLNQYYNEIIENHFQNILKENNPNIIISSGGDGTVLRTFRYCIENNLNIPFLVLKGGTFNFLPTSFNEDFYQLIHSIKNDYQKLYSFEFNPLKITYNENIYLAMNDIIIGNNINDYHKINIKTNSLLLEDISFNGMGMCLSSAIGSTGFHLNNGGQIFEDSKSFGISTIVSNVKLNEILQSNEIIIKIESDRSVANMYIDGSNFIIPLNKNKEIKIEYSKEKYTILYLNENEFLNRKRIFSMNLKQIKHLI